MEIRQSSAVMFTSSGIGLVYDSRLLWQLYIFVACPIKMREKDSRCCRNTIMPKELGALNSTTKQPVAGR